MPKACDNCLPMDRGYTFFFAPHQSLALLDTYYATFDDTKWKMLNSQTVWVEEYTAFDLLDYLDIYFDTSIITFIRSTKQAPLSSDQKREPLRKLRQEREAHWIDEIIEERHLVSYYQPIVHYDGETTRMMGHELLSRGIGKDGQLISPLSMLEAARTRHRLFALDRACRITCVEHAEVIKDQWIFINFVPTAIYIPEHCLSTTLKLINELNIPPEHVIFEVVESDDIEDIDHLKKILDYYKQQGFKYALDDIGTGTNTLKKLAYLEPHIVKLAREYVDGICENKEKQHMAQALLQVADQIGAQLLAEGVETKEDMDYLQRMGYELFQGYYISKPQAAPMTTTDVGTALSL